MIHGIFAYAFLIRRGARTIEGFSDTFFRMTDYYRQYICSYFTLIVFWVSCWLYLAVDYSTLNHCLVSYKRPHEKWWLLPHLISWILRSKQPTNKERRKGRLVEVLGILREDENGDCIMHDWDDSRMFFSCFRIYYGRLRPWSHTPQSRHVSRAG